MRGMAGRDWVLPESGGAAGYQDGRLAGYSWPWLVISLPASHFSYSNALSAIWQTANWKRQKATGQQGKQTGIGGCGTCSCANRQTSKWGFRMGTSTRVILV
ncbi:uncharacterized protein LOC108111277 [Drosophila eugracilis]|uniref:uncharacterized protein LOC108111277 n=1 Tax=Drosophila eugracilis TaxID=29029 RepID=UPI001BD92DFC|nr:uncharacterized protein LOC108111277 [Drosophila eugracilis]